MRINLKTLFVSEDKEVWEILQRLLKTIYGDHVSLTCTINLDDAIKYAISNGPYDFLVIDCDMKNAVPEEVAYSISDVNGDCPILYTGQTTTIADRVSQELFERHEKNETLPKPLEKDPLKEKLDLIINYINQANIDDSVIEGSSDLFIKMKIKNFYLYSVFGYDLYTEITSTKFMRIIEANVPYTNTILNKYARKNIKHFYIKKDDHLDYLDREGSKCLVALRKTPLDHKKIFLLIMRSIMVFHEHLLTLGACDMSMRLASAINDKVIKLVGQNYNFKELTKYYPQIYDGIANKCLLTAIISQILAEKLEWQSITTKKKLALAAIIMDFNLLDEKLAKVNDMKDLMLNDYKENSVEGFLYHSDKCADMASQFTQYPDVDFILKNHHELPNKKGFPHKPHPSKLTPVCSVFNISQFIASKIDITEINQKNIEIIFKEMLKDYNHGNFKGPLKTAREFIAI